MEKTFNKRHKTHEINPGEERILSIPFWVTMESFLGIVYIEEKISLKVLQNKIQSSIMVFADIKSVLMGHRQTVRHWTLTPASQGSNPCGPVYKKQIVIVEQGM